MKFPHLDRFFERFPHFPRIAVAIGLGVIAFIALGALGLFASAKGYASRYEGKIFPGVVIGTVPVGGLTAEQASSRVQAHIDEVLQAGAPFILEDKPINLPLYSTAGHVPYVTYSVDEASQKALAFGRGPSAFVNAIWSFQARWHTVLIDLPSQIKQPELQAALLVQLDPHLSDTEDAKLVIHPEKDAPTPVEITPERIGTTVELDRAWPAFQAQAKALHFTPTTLQATHVEPAITKQDLEPLTLQVPAILAFQPLRMTAERREWVIDATTRATWLTAIRVDSGVQLAADPDAIKASLEPLVKPFLIEAVNGRLALEPQGEGYTLKDFVAPVEGVSFDVASTSEALTHFFASPTSTPIAIVLKKVTPKIEGDDAARLGIQEALGTGRSNFSGSPANRRHNITLGKNKVNGTLVAPGQEFSMLKTLGPVTGANGWLPELVIKGNKTTPEFGGGLCQIGTTAFRTALESGLEITERRNHSYRVRYYEPAGTDATIYEPAPDFKFKNDTPNWILITGNLVDSDVSFTIWGTKDGRASSYTKSRVWNIIQPPPTKYIETLDLAPGKVKCTESAHAGADASFDYYVTSTTGEMKKVTFFSRYKPWQAVCLKGVEQLTAPVDGVDQTGINNLN